MDVRFDSGTVTVYIYIYISLPYFMFGRALSWGSAFAVCIVHCSLVYQFEHSDKVRRAWFKFGFENFDSSLLSGSASFLCAALMSPQRTKQYCPQIEYIYIYIYKQNHGSIKKTTTPSFMHKSNHQVVYLMIAFVHETRSCSFFMEP